jgi:hypothetical protein
MGEWVYRSTFFFTSTLIGDEWSASRPCRFTPGERKLRWKMNSVTAKFRWRTLGRSVVAAMYHRPLLRWDGKLSQTSNTPRGYEVSCSAWILGDRNTIIQTACCYRGWPVQCVASVAGVATITVSGRLHRSLGRVRFVFTNATTRYQE